ncbi:MAG: carboxypeptidase regulatory-like domain-containing protein [Elusimicrobiota bacterium]|nr:carboxypeptidase regulatory-like domain-containing protein [Elusimicrobiota bacterium]
MINQATIYAVQLTVDTGAAGAKVSALNFDSMRNPSPNSVFDLTDATGKAVLNIAANTDYVVFATKQGKGPSLREQVMMGRAVPVRTSGDMTISLQLNETISNVGTINIGLLNVSTGAPVVGDIRNVTTNEPVSFIMNFMDSSLAMANTNYISAFNIPAAPGNTYIVNIFSPNQNKGMNKQVAESLAADGQVTVNFDFSSQEAMAAQTQDTGITPEGNIAFEGVVVDTNSKGIADMNVQLYSQAPDTFQPKNDFFAMTDSNGRFAFYNIPADSNYYLNINGLGYAGANDGPRANGPNGPISGYTYNGTNKIVVPSVPVLPVGYNYEYCYGLTNSQYKLPAVNGRLKGVVTVGNPPVALPFANVQIWGDGDRWAGTDMFSSSSMTWSNTSSPTNARIRTGADGTFDIIGLSNGNISLGIWSDLIGINYIYNYKGDWNARNMDTTTGFRGGDDVRVSISTVPQLNNGANETTPLWCVYYASGVPIAGSTATVVINIQTEGTAACTIKGTIKFLEAANIPPTNPLVIIAREQFQGDWSTHKSKSRFIGISGTFAKGATKTYDIPVSAGTQYWVDVKSEYWGIVNRFDTQADFSNVTSGEKVLDFALAPAGKIRGVVRLPDGTIFKPVNSNTGGRWIRIKANSRVSGGDGQVPDSGVFEITGLIPGLYNITTWGDGSGYTWPKSVIITDVMVSPNRETYIEIPLTNGVKCEAIAPPYPMPAMAAGTSGYYTIAGFNSDDILTGQKLDALMDSDSETPIGFNYNTSTYTSWGVQSLGWQPTIAAPGRYNLYLIKYEMFVGRPSQDIGDGMMGSEHETFTVISQAKNVEIKYDPLQPNATTYIPFEGAVTGKGKITGKITGTNIWTSSDYEKAKKEGGKTMLKNMPTVMLYDLNGTWRGFSGARPKNDPVSIAPWEIFSVNPNETTKQKGMKDSPFYYYVDMLPPGKYIMIAETPNYPPFIKEVLIYSTATTTLDLDFDASVGSGLSISGVVTSTDTGISLEGAEVVINHKSVSKYTVTDANGAYSIAGLPKGIYRISVSKSGYALSGDKIGLGESLTGKNFQLTKGDSAITGAVYSQKIPFAKTLANAKIACYDETYNTQNKTKYLPVNKAKTDKNGNYYISGLISGHIYKVYVMATGKIVEYVEVTPVAGDNTQDFELKSLPPKLKIIVKKTENPRKYLFMFSSPKKLVAPPECWYNSGDSYDVNKAIQALPLSGPNNTYSLYVNLLETNINQNYNLRVISDDGGKKNTDDIKFGGNVKRQAKKDVAEGIAEGDDVAIDELGDDNTQIGLDAGSLIPSEATASDSPGRGAPSFAIGGFSSNIPSFQLQGTDSSLATELINVDESAVAGDVYQVDLSNSQMNKSVTLSLNYDKEKVSETDIDKLKIYQYNSDKRVWELVPGNKTIDPVSGTVSIDVESITDAVNSTSTTRLSGRAVIQNGRFVVNRAASTSQSGTFAVFKKAPPTGVAWSGDFTMFNFPNPFHLKDKTVTLVNPGGIADTNSILAGTNLSTKGTIIKYCLPAGRTGDVKIFIYNLAGELVRELDDSVRDAGYIYYVDWDGRNDRDDECASGVYFALLKVGTKTLNKGKPLKLAIIK